MRILITNDDGIYSPGIAALADVARAFGEVCIVAPDVEMSSAGHSITATRPLSYKRTPRDVEAYRVNGTPADCVSLGAYHWEKVDVVLSGLNIGLNLGNSIGHSGTVAAAKQAALLGLRGIALSAPSGAEPDFEPFKPWIRRVLQRLLGDVTLPLVNVNFPREPRGMMWGRASVRRYDGRIVPVKDPAGRTLFWSTVVPIEDADEGTDRWAVEQGWISLTPLRLEPTDDAQLHDARGTWPLDDEMAMAHSPGPSSPEAARSVRDDESEVSLTKTGATAAEAAEAK